MANDVFQNLSDEEIATLPLDPAIKEQIIASRKPAPELSTSTDPYAQLNIRQTAPAAPGPALSTTIDPYQQVAPPTAAPQPGVVYMAPNEQNEVVADRVNAMQAGTLTAGPTQVPTPLAPPHASPQDQAVQQAIADQEAQQAVTRQVASQKAVTVEAAKQAQEQTKQAEQAMAVDAANEEKIQKDLDEEGDTWGKRIGQAIAILVGGISQGYSGARENPAIVAIEKAAAAKAAAKKYNDEQKMKLEEMLYKKAQLALQQRKETIDSIIGLYKLDQADAELNAKLEELRLKKSQNMMLARTRFTAQELATIPAEQREKLSLVRLPDGSFASALSKKQAEDLYTLNKDTDAGLEVANKLMKRIEYFGNNIGKKLLDFETRGEVRGMAQALVGAMKLPYVGPGAFTDTEQRLLKDIIGDPTRILSLKSANKAGLQTVIDKLKYYRRVAHRHAGIDLPLSKNEQILKEYLQARPQLSEGQAISNLAAAGAWDSSEL